MINFANEILASNGTFDFDGLTVTHNNGTVFVTANGKNDTFTMADLREEYQHEIALKKKQTVLVKTEDGFRTDFYAKNLINEKPADASLLAAELSYFKLFSKNNEKIAADLIERTKQVRADRIDFLYGTEEEPVGAIHKDLRKQCKDYDWEKAKAGAAKLCGGAKVASRNNHIDFQASCISQKTGNVKSFKQSNRQFEKQCANPRVNFKAKENYNSKGAVRGGSTSLTPKNGIRLATNSELIQKAIPSAKPFDMEGAIKAANTKAAKKCAKQAARRAAKKLAKEC